jgi:hypothetical protein
MSKQTDMNELRKVINKLFGNNNNLDGFSNINDEYIPNFDNDFTNANPFMQQIMFENMDTKSRYIDESNYVPFTNINTNTNNPEFITNTMMSNSFLTGVGLLGIYLLFCLSKK